MKTDTVKTSNSSHDYGLPSSYYVFVVGHCEEWPEGREDQGDIGLYNEFLASGVPSDQTKLIKDRACTQPHCQQALEDFLKGTRPGTTLVFSYGGHGNPAGFKTIQRVWRFQKVVETIEQCFAGERVLFLVDCCASGNLATWLTPPYCRHKKYACLTTSLKYIETSDVGDEWVMNQAWIKSLQCTDGNLALSTIIEYIADRTVIMMQDQYTAYVSEGVDCDAGDWLPRRQQQLKNSTSSTPLPPNTLAMPKLELNLPPRARVSPEITINDHVFYKHPGGFVDLMGSKRYMTPGWYFATIHSDHGQLVGLTVHCTYDFQLSWTVAEVPRDQLINIFYLDQMWMMPKKFKTAQVWMAQRFKYLDYSLSANTILRAMDDDGELREAMVVDWRDFNWIDVRDKLKKEKHGETGGHIPVRWTESQDMEILATSRIQYPTIVSESFPPQSTAGATDTVEKASWARSAMLNSIRSSNKIICNAQNLLSTDKLMAFWPDDGRWYKASPLEPDTISIEIMATHSQFRPETGRYCPIRYSDGEEALVPLVYIRNANSVTAYTESADQEKANPPSSILSYFLRR